MKGQFCKNCKFFIRCDGVRSETKEDGVELGLAGYCRRFPPVPNDNLTESEGQISVMCWSFPSVDGDSWCGEWQPLPMKPPVSGK